MTHADWWESPVVGDPTRRPFARYHSTYDTRLQLFFFKVVDQSKRDNLVIA